MKKRIYIIFLISYFLLFKLPVYALNVGDQDRVTGVMCKVVSGEGVVSIVDFKASSPGYTDIKCDKEGTAKLDCITLNSSGAKASDISHTIKCYNPNNTGGSSTENCTTDSNTPCFPGVCTSNNESILSKYESGSNYTKFKCVGSGQTSVSCDGKTIPFKCSGSSSEGTGEDIKPDIDIGNSDPPSSDVLKGVCDVNSENNVLRAFKMGGVAINILKILIPILLIILGSIDFAQAVISSDEKQISKSTMKLVQRVIAGVAIFFAPMLVNYIFDLVDSNATNRYKTCYDCLLDVSSCPEIPKVGS